MLPGVRRRIKGYTCTHTGNAVTAMSQKGTWIGKYVSMVTYSKRDNKMSVFHKSY